MGEFVTGTSYTAKEEGTYYVIGVGDGIGCENQSADIELTYDDLEPTPAYPTDPEFTLNPTGTTTWGSGVGASSIPHHALKGYIVVEDGQKLIIKGQNTILRFYDGTSGIKVHKGGVLVVDGATLTASKCGTEWDGVIVYGDGLKAHPNYEGGPLNPFIGSDDHGLVALINGATIKNARTAVKSTFKYDALQSNGQPYNIGGGIVYADGANFENNNTSILLGQFKADEIDAQKSKIKNCIFKNTTLWENNDFFGSSGSIIQNANKGYEQVLVMNAGKGLNLYGNQFETTFTSDDYKERGVGLRIVGTPLTVGEAEDGALIPNYFDNLYKGIDIYNFLNVENTPHVVNNEFTNVFKGITLNTTPGSVITGNTFLVPESDDSDNHSYGILTHQSFGFDVSDNCFMTETEETDSDYNFTKGLIIKTSHFGNLTTEEGTLTSIRENRFAGHFKVATQIEGDNKKMQMRCNDYLNEIDPEIAALRDWFLPEQSLEGVATEIQPQGICSDETQILDPFASTWNQSNDAAKLHVLNQMQAETGFVQSIIFTPDNNPNSIPTKLNDVDAIGVTNCIFQSEPTNIQVDCGVDANCVVELAPEVGGGLPPFYYYPPPMPTSRPNDNCVFYADRVRSLLVSGQYQSVLDMLHCQNTLGANRLLAANHAIKGNVGMTTNALDNIPSNNYDNVEFKELVTAVLQKQVSVLERIAGYTYSPNAAYAQSALASLEGQTYHRTSAIEASSGHGTAKRSIASTHKESISGFRMYPNPAIHTLTIQLNTSINADNRSFRIYNMNGQLVRTVLLSSAMTNLSIESLPTGIYYCHLEDQAKVKKLVIVK